MHTLPLTLPSAYAPAAGQPAITSDLDVGGYDVMIGGHGFRLATDQQFYYSRSSEQTTTHRFDSESEPGEQSLSALPWIKSQSSFHAGAGQLNLEQGLAAFEYQQEKIDHIRFDTCLGVDTWTPGQVTRLPDVRLFSPGFNITNGCTATIGGFDYAILGGVGGLYQAAWVSGPDVNPVVTRIDLSGSTFVSNANCSITSLCTDGANYYAVVEMATAGFVSGTVTFIVRGSMATTDPPTAIYKCVNVVAAPDRHNLCGNPSFEADNAGWLSSGTIARSTLHHYGVWSDSHGHSANETASGVATATLSGPLNVGWSFSATVGAIYTGSIYVYAPSGTPDLHIFAGSGTTNSFGTSTSLKDQWVRLSVTLTAADPSTFITVETLTNPTVGQQFFVDDCLIELSSTAGLYFDGARYDDPTIGAVSWDGTANDSTSKAVFFGQATQLPGVVGWQKARLVAGIGSAFYELNANAGPLTVLPSPKYTAPVPAWTWTAVSESPTGVLAAGAGGNKSSILEFTLDSSGATPVLTGGATVAQLPVGEQVQAMEAVLGTWLSIATSRGLRIGSFDTYTGRLKIGALSVNTTSPCLDVAARDRFVYAGYTNQQPDGSTGLVRVDLSIQVDVAGRLSYAPDLRPPSTAPTGRGAVYYVDILPLSGRMFFVTPEGLHTEGNGPGSDGSAWIRTSRIRYDTAEMKLFKLGRLHGTLDTGNIQVTGITPFGNSANLGTFGFETDGDPGEFRLPTGTHEWIQLQFSLIGSGSALNTYQVKAYPAPARQHVYTITVNCFRNETDRFGLDVTDPETPRTRLKNLTDLEAIGDQVRYVEFTNEGSVASLVLIDQMEFKSFSRPNIEDDFGGYITMRLRTTEN